MGAAIALDELGGRGLAGVPQTGTIGPRRRHLTVVPPLASAQSATISIRLTRAGRLAVTLTIACALAVAITVLAVGPGAAVGGGIEREIAVFPGQTLSQIAADQLPEVPIRQGVAQLVLANNLPSTQITAGQHLLIPAGR